MCGRFSLSTSKEKIQEQFGIESNDEIQLSFNIAPTHQTYVVASDAPEQLQQMVWGLIPYWANDGHNNGKLINARGESISSKPSFRMPIRKRRCLVIADSFYEWRREGINKIPYRICLKDDQLLAFAGVWDLWTNGEKEIKSFSIITTTANQEISQLHNRMPVVLNTPEQRQQWLADIPLSQALDMLQPMEDHKFKVYRVSPKLNSPAYNAVDLHESVPEPPTLF